MRRGKRGLMVVSKERFCFGACLVETFSLGFWRRELEPLVGFVAKVRSCDVTA
jgi:hypothetical protein